MREHRHVAPAAASRPPDPTAAVRRLPVVAIAGLREAFAAEVAERLPRLTGVVGRTDLSELVTAVRDAHALGSSAAVLGEPDASHCAREAERLLLGLHAGADASWFDAGRAVDDLNTHLLGWTA